jgi:hypothetical protein
MKRESSNAFHWRAALVLVAFALLAAAMVSCGGGSSTPSTSTTANFSQIVVLPTAVTTSVGKQQSFAATAETAAGAPVTGVTFTWSSSATSVATVASDGQITGLVTATGPGTANITATATNTAGTSIKSSVATITVTPTIASITISPTTATIAHGATQQYTATALDASGNAISGVQFAWFTSYAAIATIDQNGLATGVAPGTVTIQASAGGVNSSPATLTVQ